MESYIHKHNNNACLILCVVPTFQQAAVLVWAELCLQLDHLKLGCQFLTRASHSMILWVYSSNKLAEVRCGRLSCGSAWFMSYPMFGILCVLAIYVAHTLLTWSIAVSCIVPCQTRRRVWHTYWVQYFYFGVNSRIYQCVVLCQC